MDAVAVVGSVTQMLRGYAERFGPRVLDELSHPRTKIAVMRDGGVGVTVTECQPAWGAYAFTSRLPALQRLKQMCELAGKDEAEPGQKLGREAEAFAALYPPLMEQIAKEAFERMLVLPEPSALAAVTSVAPATVSPVGRVDVPAPAAVDRPLFVVILIWAAVLFAVRAAAHVGGAIGAILVGAPLALALGKRWGASIPNAALVIALPIITVLMFAADVAIKDVVHHATVEQLSATAEPAANLPATTPTQPSVTPDAVVWDATEGGPAPTESTEAAWTRDVQWIFGQYPALSYGGNSALMQEKLNTLNYSGLTNRQMLVQAANAARADRRWSQTP